MIAKVLNQRIYPIAFRIVLRNDPIVGSRSTHQLIELDKKRRRGRMQLRRQGEMDAAEALWRTSGLA